ncbi:MAG: alcohol dehydrogenase [Syntrophus sp. RIFOXYC2_FULL_54_9]|nr:MAG: alcohol dehydrogenase [Syntrophus sp. GWC2_56_31]OHE32106.1 MAG: alcohol dehydrogenase [Syntrophus sp. RIFOXYC2_FULL_54_9]
MTASEKENLMMIPGIMQAAVLVGPSRLEVKEVAIPEPGPMEVLLKVESCACCSTDVALMEKPFAGQPPFGSFIPGHEYAGTVAALGDTVDEFEIGDRVAVEAHLGCLRCKNCRIGNYTACLNYGSQKHRANGMTANGGFAQYVVNNVNTLHRLPASIDFNEAALITNLGCVLYGFQTLGGYVAGDHVAVIGPGPLGLISVQVAKTLGAERVYLIGTRESRLNVGAATGADRIINVHNEDPLDVVFKETHGVGADFVIECSGGQDAPMMAIRIAKPMGKILLLGIPYTPVSVDFAELIQKNKSIHTARGEGWSNVARAVSMVGSGRITLKPYVTHAFPLEKISTAFKTFSERIGGAVKVIVKPNVKDLGPSGSLF